MPDAYDIELVALEAEVRVAYEGLDAATEGVGAEYQEVISDYVSTLNGIDAKVRRAVAQSNKKALIDACDEGIRVCDEFHDAMTKIPPDKFAKVKDLLPCFKVLLRVTSIVMLLGGNKVVAKAPAVKWLIQKFQFQSGFATFLRDLFFGGHPILSILTGEPSDPKVPERNWLVKKIDNDTVNKIDDARRKAVPVAIKARGVIRQGKQILAVINEQTAQSRYMKMIREEDKDQKKTRANKYNAVLGQIEEMKAMYEDMKKGADAIIAGSQGGKAAVENFMSLEYLWGPALEAEGYTREEYLPAVESALLPYEATPAMELMLNTTASVVDRNAKILWDITGEMWNAADSNRRDDAMQFARQGLRSCDRFVAELKNVPSGADGVLNGFIRFVSMAEFTIMIFDGYYITDYDVQANLPDVLGIKREVSMALSTARIIGPHGQIEDTLVQMARNYLDSMFDTQMMGEAESSQLMLDLIDIVAATVTTGAKSVAQAIRVIRTIQTAISSSKALKAQMGMFVRYLRSDDKGDFTMAQKLVIGEIQRFRKLFSIVADGKLDIQTKTIKKLPFKKLGMESMLMDTITREPIATSSIPAPATEADVSWLFD